MGVLAILVFAACGPAASSPVTEMEVVCDAETDRALVTNQELAFLGTVVESSAQENPQASYQRLLADDGTIDSAEEAEELALIDAEGEGEPETWLWTTFDVEAWYTRDAGEQISIWTPGLDIEVGQSWLISGAAFGTPEGLGDHMDQSGMATVCASRPFDDDAAAQWDEWFGGTVVPGSMEAEGEPDPVAVEEIEAGRELWNGIGPDSYTARMRMWTGEQSGESDCEASGLLRVVVVDGVVEEAVNVERGCRVQALEDVYVIDDLFDLAITASGAAEDYGYEIDPTYGYPRQLYGYDRSIELEAYVESLIPSASFALLGDEVGNELASMREQWDAAGISDYTFVVDWLCFCEFWGPSVVTVTGGETESVVFEGESGSGGDVDPEFLERLPGTVDELFDLIELEASRADLVVAGFDLELGYPTDVYIDSITNAIDDELTVVVHGFEEAQG